MHGEGQRDFVVWLKFSIDLDEAARNAWDVGRPTIDRKMRGTAPCGNSERERELDRLLCQDCKIDSLSKGIVGFLKDFDFPVIYSKVSSKNLSKNWLRNLRRNMHRVDGSLA
jgi:hypothetical protein